MGLKQNGHALAFAVATVAAGLVGHVHAADIVWNGTTSGDYNNGANWTPAGPPSGDNNGIINTTTPNIATISADTTVAPPIDTFVGVGAGNTGRLDITAGNASLANGWSFVGIDGATGTLNVANTAATGTGVTGLGQGSGSLNLNGRLYVGGRDYGSNAGTGTFNVNTTGTVTIANDFAVGSGNNATGDGGTGVVRVDAGTVNTGGWNFVGKAFNGSTGGSGTLTLAGGTFNSNGDRTFVGLGNTAGTMVLSNGAIYNNVKTGNDNVQFAIGSNNNANATTASVQVNGTSQLNVNRLLAVGGTEAFNGDANADFVGTGKGSLTVNGGAVAVTGELWSGQGVGSTGQITLNSGSISVNSWVAIGRQGATGGVTIAGGTFNKTGGGAITVGTQGSGPGTGTITVSGGTLNMAEGNADNNNTLILGENGSSVGTLNQTGGTVIVGNELRVGSFETATGNYNLSGGILDLTGGPIVKAATATANFAFTGGTIRNAASIDIGNFAQSGGTLAPGAAGATGTTAITGNYTTSGTAVYAADVTVGNASDLITVSGLATLGGSLSVNALGTLTAGEVFTILTYGTLSGTFTGLPDDSTFNQAGNTFLIDYNNAGNNVTLTVVPEPSALAVLGVGAAALLRRRRNPSA